jgi:hypothetical protein
MSLECVPVHLARRYIVVMMAEGSVDPWVRGARYAEARCARAHQSANTSLSSYVASSYDVILLASPKTPTYLSP